MGGWDWGGIEPEIAGRWGLILTSRRLRLSAGDCRLEPEIAARWEAWGPAGGLRGIVSVCLCLCVCVCVCVCVCACACVCVWLWLWLCLSVSVCLCAPVFGSRVAVRVTVFM